MKKLYNITTLNLLFFFIFQYTQITYAQEYTKWDLPEKAIARIG